ncbi:HpcH/HpaI aldolase/citrate lyase family protein [Plastoroseomonas arctica]|uniref:CoA ester lyase n=1 Tax=Plastoroseomonas arctica TaxID=1509237 RepID=A0AAF1K3X5_9PROT|nr:CoA ester lyase [Plastoroseomonas arctica]MBR0655370.1 CoA ester lyase [Plastoroseomonas arctica]
MTPAPNRSFLFAPGDHPRRSEKVLTIGADAAILDLEDAVANSAKVAARDAVVATLQRPRACRGYVRVNAFETPFCFGDIQAVIGPRLDGLLLPKLESAAQLIGVDWMVAALERAQGLPERGIDIIPIIETARGHDELRNLMQATAGLGGRVRRMAFGAGDYTLDLGIAWSLEESELATIRADMVMASRSAGLEAPLDTVWIELRETEAFTRNCARSAALGFQGRMCIHPDQIPIANAAYAPTEVEVARARTIAAAFAEAEARGLASIQVDGRFVDYPIVERALRLLRLHESITAHGAELR